MEGYLSLGEQLQKVLFLEGTASGEESYSRRKPCDAFCGEKEGAWPEGKGSRDNA